MLEILDAPVPFLIGIHSRYLHEVDPKKRPNDVVFVDLDRDVVQMGVDMESGEKRKVPRPPDRDSGKLKSSLDLLSHTYREYFLDLFSDYKYDYEKGIFNETIKNYILLFLLQ